MRNSAQYTPHPAFYAAQATFPAGSFARGCIALWSIGMVLDGHCNYRFGDRELLATTGDFMIFRPRLDCQWRVPEDAGKKGWQTVYVAFHPRPHWIPWLQLPEVLPGCAVLPVAGTPLFPRLRRLLVHISKLHASNAPQHDEWAMLSIERILLILQNYTQQSTTDPRVDRAIRLLHAEYARDWTMEALALECHSSTSHLSVLFAQEMGLAPMQYLEQVRIQRAMEKLALGNESVDTIARDVGYRYRSYFARRFRRCTGQSPLEYREVQKTKPLAD